MIRAISALVAVLVLLGVGWTVGHRPVARCHDRMEQLEAEFQARQSDLEQRAQTAEARGYLWQARAELLLASHEVDRRNFGTAGKHAEQARELLTRAAAVPHLTLDLSPVRDMVDSAVGKIEAMDPDSGAVLMRAASELGRLLEKTGHA